MREDDDARYASGDSVVLDADDVSAALLSTNDADALMPGVGCCCV